MREIKFRAWNKITKNMLYKIAISPEGKIMFHYQPDYDFELMQFTGLLDSKGKEIWEGDIFKNARVDLFVIVFENGGFRGKRKSYKGDDPYGFHFDYYEATQGEVISNIYENPKLLEVS